MLKRYCLVCGLIWLSVWSLTALAQEPCEPAVDLADSFDAVNRIGDCDYSDQGLNKLLSGRTQAQDKEPSQQQASSSAPAPDTQAQAQPAHSARLASTPVSDGLGYTQQRFQLLQRAAQLCQPLKAEIQRQLVQYGSDGLVLTVEYHCTSQ
ncbi:hypothetical protein KO507_09295 [Gilvimarinus agarilyticus]|uniref:hypothetical protein n=1 Tax=unclassified Gilvimarinus TaxID=2642066 RepID=UPI001C0882D1|nr:MULTISPECIES: hypothetical protein [unclassified Gilvimarinus]MBU2885954.1 hypothetical protein [Gilvimarinus agarilyticus]MDO6570700.1 hypothetical protein [Gilvimarinus sp. 2_MG-2023]MDO6747707.1 hypothetical protein [Gilvimarinus sp. 1_MG-2023]